MFKIKLRNDILKQNQKQIIMNKTIFEHNNKAIKKDFNYNQDKYLQNHIKNKGQLSTLYGIFRFI